MFDVVEGKAKILVPLLGSKVVNRDGTFTTYKDIAVKAPKKLTPLNLHPSSRNVDPKGYR
jgi:hypothetical protein